MKKNHYTSFNFQLPFGLSSKCLALASVQLFLSHETNHNVWEEKKNGIICLMREVWLKNHLFQLYSPMKKEMIWEFRISHKLNYDSASSFFHTFSIENRIVALNFESEHDAKLMESAVKTMNSKFIDPVKSLPTNNEKRKKRRNLSETDIGSPQDFIHISHVGAEPNKGFNRNNADPNWEKVLSKVSVLERQLQNSESQGCIYASCEVPENISETQEQINPIEIEQYDEPPPVPSRKNRITASNNEIRSENNSNLTYVSINKEGYLERYYDSTSEEHYKTSLPRIHPSISNIPQNSKNPVTHDLNRTSNIEYRKDKSGIIRKSSSVEPRQLDYCFPVDNNQVPNKPPIPLPRTKYLS